MSFNVDSSQFIEPPLRRGRNINERFRHWYSSIADLRIREPGITNREVALRLGKHENTIGMIVGTDMFKEYFHQRREAWRIDHDHAIRAKMTDVASEGLDIVLEQLKAKRTQIPLNAALKVTESALDRLGYAPASAPTVVVDNSVHDNRQQTVQVTGLSAKDLEEARAALRLSEQTRIGTSLPQALAVDLGLEQGAGHVSDVEDQNEEVLSDPSS